MKHILTGSPEEPLVIDSEPLGFTQGHIVAANKEDLTIDIQIMEGYTAAKDCGGRIEMFSPDGVMLPHNQDPNKEVEDLGEPLPDILLGPRQAPMSCSSCPVLIMHAQLYRGCQLEHSASMVVQHVNSLASSLKCWL